MATVFVHMIPEVRESLETARKLGAMAGSTHDHDHDHGYPMAELVVCAGFFIIYLIEALVHKIFGLDHNHSHVTPKKNEAAIVENGIDNPVFEDGHGEPKTICSPVTSEDNHPDASGASLGFKYRFVDTCHLFMS